MNVLINLGEIINKFIFVIGIASFVLAIVILWIGITVIMTPFKLHSIDKTLKKILAETKKDKNSPLSA